MRNVARLPESDRRELFRNTADKMGLNDAIVEKDFWVCFTLDYLFHRCPWKETITFKGGTSLSKAFNLISRFSEDIDLILDWRVLGYGKDEPWEKTFQHQTGYVQQRSQCSGRGFSCGAVLSHHSGRTFSGAWL